MKNHAGLFVGFLKDQYSLRYRAGKALFPANFLKFIKNPS
jgi:hypothetical protein